MGKKNKPEPEFVACDGKIYFKPIEARDLKGGKKLTPFCKVYQDKEKKFESDVIMKTHDPAWGESARLIILDENVPIEKIRFVVMHKGTIMKDYIGELSFKITDLLDGVPRDDWFVLKNKKGSKNMGEIHLQIMYLDKSEDMSKQTDEFPYPLQTLLRKKSYKPWNKLIDQGCDIDKPDREGKTALHVCAELNLKEHLQTLLQRNADVAAKDNEERTALHVAAQYGSTECISVLLEMGAQINAKDKHAQTPLHIAAAGNQIAVATLLLDAGAGVSAQDENGDTPLHVALRAASNESVRLLIDRGADIYLENAKGQSSCTLSVVVGEENEAVRKCFFQAVNVVDAREFDLKRKYKHRTIVGGEGLKEYEHWLNDPQFAISGPKGADVHLVMHYDDPISKVTLPMEKNGFLLFRNYQKTNKELTYWYDDIKYGQVTPTELTIEEDDASYAVIVYSKMAKLSGKWFIVAYSDSEINVNPLVDWENVLTIDGKWEGASAGGSIGNQDTFTKNPKYKIALPAQTVRLYILLAQERNMGDVERFSIISYKYHIGFYIFKEDMTEPIQEEPIYKTAKFKNARENVLYVEIDGAKFPNVILLPATAKAGETSEFEITIASDVKLATPVQLESLPKMDEYEPSKKKTRKKKKST